jgi:rhodanese-related sulfurtransferase
MNKREIFLLLASAATVTLCADEVEITKDMPSVTYSVNGKTYTISRENRPNTYLTNTYALTSRPSPPFFVQPFKVSDKVETYGELELLDFVKNKKGLFIDARLPNWYEKSAIPGAVNIPFKIFLKDSPERDKVLQRLGVRYDKHGKYDFSHAKTILLYCNGAWCGQSPTAIKALMKLGYPEEKMKYYRGGMQAWQLLGLTTIVPQKDQK